MIRKSKKSIIISGCTTVIILLLVCFFYKWFRHYSNVEIRYVDDNKTPITYVKTIKKRAFEITSIKYPELDGYILKEKRKTRILVQPVHNSVVEVEYSPKKTNQLKIVNRYKYVGAAFQAMYQKPSGGSQGDPRPNELGIDRLKIILSNDGIHWRTLQTNYPNLNVRDPSIVKIRGYWYLIFTDGLVRTRDFLHWENMNWKMQKKMFANEWAPEFFKDKAGNWHIIMCAERVYSPHGTQFAIYTTNFDQNNGQVGDKWTKITGSAIPKNALDPNMSYINGKYYLWYKNEDTKTLHLVTSNNYTSDFNLEAKNNLQNHQFYAYEAPENQNNHRLYFDTYDLASFRYHGIMSVEQKNGQYTNPKPISGDFLIRHFSVFER